jgi:hypothetical protein
MDARIIATNVDKVVVLWHQRGINKSGEVFDGEVLALYEVQQGRLRRAKMFYFDSSAVAEFLAGSRTDQPYEFSKEETRDHAGEANLRVSLVPRLQPFPLDRVLSRVSPAR